MPAIYRSLGSMNRLLKDQVRGLGGVNRQIKEQYRGYGGVNRRVFNSIDANTMLLCHFDSSLVDAVGLSTLTGASIGYGTGKFDSAVLFGTSNSLATIPYSLNINPTTSGDWSIDFWTTRPGYSSAPSGTNPMFFGNPPSSGTTTTGFQIYYDGQFNRIKIEYGKGTTSGSITLFDIPSDGLFHHIAICKSGTTFYSFLDGVLKSTNTSVSVTTATRDFIVGKMRDGTVSLNCYMDELRISNICRWTSGFAVPTAAY